MAGYRAPRRLSDQVAIDVGSKILSGELTACARLPTEAELGKELGVSRTVVRDAIRTLSAQGLVEVRHGFGMVVASPTEAAFVDALGILLLRSDLTVGDILDARKAIEAGVCVLAASRSTAEDRKTIERDFDAFVEAIQREDWEAVDGQHLRFHLDLLRAAHLPAAEMILRPMQHVVLLSSSPPVVHDPELWDVPAHRQIVDALASQDEPSLREALLAHYYVMDRAAFAELRATRLCDAPGAKKVFNQILGAGRTSGTAEQGNGRWRDVHMRTGRRIGGVVADPEQDRHAPPGTSTP